MQFALVPPAALEERIGWIWLVAWHDFKWHSNLFEEIPRSADELEMGLLLFVHVFRQAQLESGGKISFLSIAVDKTVRTYTEKRESKI